MKQFLKFSLVGISNTLIDFVVYAGLTRGFAFWKEHFLWANVIAASLAVTWSFFWNKHWTFQNRSSAYAAQYMRFVFVSTTAILLSQAMLAIGVGLYHFFDLFVKLAAVAVQVIWSFSFHRLWTFREQLSHERK